MENMMGLLSVHVQRGVNLAVRDMRSSDPYVVVKMSKQVFIWLASFILLLTLCVCVCVFFFFF
ncbi:hypothetical protein C1H46_023364 [Malus baccata]|uniref:C2 domain-containing protein n=1 Tax=Malus baccata TaxID=106549 RepID=A0A540LX04_MALBA|nr:hypothetical protein C1H46_023364 [Malus baccata]